MCILCLGNSSECFATKDRQPSHEPTAGRQVAQRKCPVIYVWLMSLRSVPLWQKLRTDWPRRITGRRQGYGPAGKELKEKFFVNFVLQ